MENLWGSRSPYGEDFNECTGFFAKDSKYFVQTCKSKNCIICAWKDAPVFNLRGLCTDTQVGSQYVLLPEKNLVRMFISLEMEKITSYSIKKQVLG